jgi:hypothetical protein
MADAQRIADVVLRNEGARRGRKNSTLPRAAGGGGQSSSVEFATFTGGWVKNQYKTVTLTLTDTTATAYNSFSNIASSGGTRRCAVARYAGVAPSGNTNEYFLISAECF